LLQSVKLIGKFLLLLGLITTIAGCNSLSNKSKLNKVNANTTLDEKPAILDISTSVIWDGEQTLGGNWISHPNVDSPERVLIKNNSNGKSIVGAIFQQTKKTKTETAVISSDAAKALDIVQNKQTKVQIIAVRVAKSNLPTPDIIRPSNRNIATTETKLSKPFIQVGIFGIENNANRTKDQMLKLNLPVNIFNFQIKNKPYWRVIVGPAATSESRNNIFEIIKSAGFSDAYFVTN
jgi:hypothetical protein